MSAIGADVFRVLFESLLEGYFVHDDKDKLIEVNARTCADLGYDRHELMRLTINDISCGATPAENAARWAEATPGTAMTFMETAVRKDGTPFPVEISVVCEIVDGVKLFLGLARDVTERQAARAAIEEAHAELERRVEERTDQLQAAHERLVLAAGVGGMGIWDLDITTDGLYCDAQWYRIMGRDPREPVRSVAEFRMFVHPDDAERATEIEPAASRLLAMGADYGIDFRIVRPDGEVRWLHSTASVRKDASGVPSRVVGFVVDVTEARQTEQQLRRLNLSLQERARTLARRGAELGRQVLEDPLTGVANRRGLDRALARAWQNGVCGLALAMIDVDFFKSYNDNYGHAQGDEALRTVAGLIADAAQWPGDIAARFGGEEFVLLLRATDQATAVCEGIMARLAALRLPHDASPISPYLTISCGCVVMSDKTRREPASLLKLVDKALYRAKREGRNRLVVSRV